MTISLPLRAMLTLALTLAGCSVLRGSNYRTEFVRRTDAAVQQTVSDGQVQPAAAGDLDTSFNPGIGVTSGGSVLAIAAQDDGKLLLSGFFTSYDGTSCNGLVRVNSGGAIDPSFHSGAGPRTVIYSILAQNDGKILIGGHLNTYDGVSRNGVARLNGDGTLDSTFNPGDGITNGISLSIRALAIQPDQKILLGGVFNSYNGTARNRIARINSDGSLDNSFDPGTGASSTVRAISIQNDGKIIIGGVFTSFNGVARNYVARLNGDGALDPTFVGGLQTFVGGLAGVYSLATQPDGKIILGGLFNVSAVASMLVRVNSDGTFDSLFTTAMGGTVHAVSLQNDGKILMAGNFNDYNGTGRNRIARANSNGSLDATFDPGAGAAGGRFDSLTVTSSLATQTGKILFGSIFTSYAGLNRAGIVRINDDGSLDASFDPGNGAAANGFVYRMAIQNDGKILIGGHFTGYNNGRRNGIARINQDGSLDSSLDPGIGTEENSTVTSLVIQSDGKVLIGGSFTTYNGVNRTGFARINSDGSVDNTFNPATNGIVTAIALQDDGRIVVGGFFTSVQGASRNHVARLNADGTLDTSFDPSAIGINGTINTVAIQKDGKILFGGDFPTADGSSQTALVRFNADGSLDESFKPPTANHLNTIVLQDDGRILIGGSQEIVFNNGVSRFGVARLNSDGSLDTSFDPGVTWDLLNDEVLDVFALAVQTDGRIIVGGFLLRYDNVPVDGFVRAKLDGRIDSSFAAGSGATPIYAAAIQTDGKILIGGDFDDYNGVALSGIARILPGPATTIPTIQFGAQSYSVSESGFEVTVSVTRTGDLSVASTVDYATNDTASTNCTTTNGKASSRCDYLKSRGRLNFAVSESSKSISVPILDDSYNEGSENFNVFLTNPANAILGSLTATVVTINDNETSSGSNPIDQSTFFVRQHYLDFLNRQPDQPGLAFWVGNINNCTPQPVCLEPSRVSTSASFYLSIEFRDTGYLVERLYKTAFGDAPGTSTFPTPHQLTVPIVRFDEFLFDTQEIGRGIIVGQPGWEQQLENQKNVFVDEFVQRSRFTAALPNTMQVAHFVNTLNANAGNPLSQSECDQLEDDLLHGRKTRAQVLRLIAEHPSLVEAERSRAFVLMQYFGYLRRNPDDPQDSDYTGYDFWLIKLNQFNGNYIEAEMVKGFITSIEYRQRFGP
jgi:uncharacterized delta-60 repeat protein